LVMMTGVPSGSAATATAVTPLGWPVSGRHPAPGKPSALHTCTVSSPLLMMTGVPFGSATAARICTR